MSIVLFFVSLATYSFTTSGQRAFTLAAGEYYVECYGGQGGGSYKDGKLTSSKGGRGAFMSGTMKVTGTGTRFYVFVGGQSKATNEYGPNEGGFKGGGNGGKDIEIHVWGTGGEAPGGGGGATDLRIFNTSAVSRIIVAAGGSGAAVRCDGAPGGTSCGYRTNGANNKFITDCTKISNINGVASGIGQNGQGYDSIPSSGAGGGWRGGIAATDDLGDIDDGSWKSVSMSGSSYISGYISPTNPYIRFTNYTRKANFPTGSGKFYLYTNYECSSNCSSCTSSSKCTECFDKNFLHESKCIPSYPNGYYGSNRTCYKCAVHHCVDCSDGYNKCKKCAQSYNLENDQCIPNTTIPFSQSFYFTKSPIFSKSRFFIESSPFTKSFDFSKSLVFSNLSEFSTTMDFSKSSIFSKSSCFSKSSVFSKSSEFSTTIDFSKSSVFSKSSEFSTTMDFSKSSIFSKSSCFSKSSVFSKSSEFSTTIDFSKSSVFSKSSEFYTALDSSKSSIFSKILDFSTSSAFTESAIVYKTSKSADCSQQDSSKSTESEEENERTTYFVLDSFTKSNYETTNIKIEITSNSKYLQDTLVTKTYTDFQLKTKSLDETQTKVNTITTKIALESEEETSKNEENPSISYKKGDDLPYPQTQNSNKKRGNNLSLIIGIVIEIVVMILIVTTIIIIIIKKRHRADNDNDNNCQPKGEPASTNENYSAGTTKKDIMSNITDDEDDLDFWL